jgi:hypothetical protein
MANRRFELFEYRQVLVRMRQGDSDRDIARAGLMGRKKLTPTLEPFRDQISSWSKPSFTGCPQRHWAMPDPYRFALRITAYDLSMRFRLDR